MDIQLKLQRFDKIRPRILLELDIWQDLRLIWFGFLLLLLSIVLQDWFSFLKPIRVVLGLIYLLYMPGYCLTAALFPYQDELDPLASTGLSIGLSIAVIPLLALILNQLPWGIRLWPILLGEAGVIAFAIVVALWRRAISPEPLYEWPTLQWKSVWLSWRSLPRFEKGIHVMLVAVLLMAGLSAVWILFVPSADEYMTEFYLLSQEGLPENYPRQARAGEELTVTMGIINNELNEHRYRVEVWAVDPWTDQRKLVSESELGVIAQNMKQEEGFAWSMPWAGDDQKAEFLLFIDNDSQPYRQLELWLNVSQGTN